MPFSTEIPHGFLSDTSKASDSNRPKIVTGTSDAEADANYPQGVLVSDDDRESAQLVTKTIASSLSPFQPLRPLREDLSVFNIAVLSVVEAVKDEILTEDEGNAVIEMISRALAHRRVDAAFMHLATPGNPVLASFGINNAK